MKRIQKKEALLASLALTLTLSAVPKSLTAVGSNAVLAQSTAPSSASDTPIRIDGSSSMAVTNQNTTQRLKQQSPGKEVQVNYQGTDPALQEVQDGKVDLAAVGRPLTADEKAKSLIAVPQDRRKIAIVVGPDNPFKGDITFVQFAKIFRGEITDWSELGGAPGPIRVVDRPETSDTRQAFQTYAVFKEAPFQVAPNAIKLTQDDTDAMIQQLGTNGIGYAISDQVTDKPGVRIVPMHKTLPSDPRYPFSQPLAYVYKGPTPNPAASAFLGYAPSPLSNPVAAAPAAVPAAPQAPAPAAPAAPQATAPAQNTTDLSWLPWLLLLPLLGGLLWWLLKNRSAPAAAPVAAAKVVPIVPVEAAAPVEAAPVVAPPVAPVVVSEPTQPDLKLYEERLIVDKSRQKVGDVSIKKQVETERAEISVPIEKERIVIEHVTHTDAPITASDADFREGEVTRLETYEETPNVHKETFVREEVSIRKEVDHDTVEAQTTVRKEELDIGVDGNAVVDKNGDRR